MTSKNNGIVNGKPSFREIGSNLASKEYNVIALKYQKAAKRELRNFTLEPSLIKYLGNLSGKKVLDLACGDGNSSRLNRNLGAKEVLGIDISEKEVRMAVKIEENLRKKARETGLKIKEIKYLVGDAAGDLSYLGEYDVVTAVMLLHYSNNKKTIDKIVKNVKAHLKRNGIFITSTPNPELVRSYNNYGVKFKSETNREGSPFAVTLSDFRGNKFCSFTNYYWTKKTYQKIFKKNGFKIEWLNSFVSDKGLKKYGEKFWKKFKEKPIYLIIRAKLK